MGKPRQSLIGHLTLTAWESWAAEPHWRNAVIIALVGSIAFTMSTPSPSRVTPPSTAVQNTAPPQSSTSGSTSTTIPSTMNSNATLLTPTSKAPPKLKPKITTDNVIINETKDKDTKDNNFGRSYGDN